MHDASIAKECHESFLKKNQRNDQNNYSANKNYRKPRYYLHKISYYKTSKNFS